MRDFLTIFKFELKTQLLKRAGIITMVVMMLIVAVVTSLPRIIALFEGGTETAEESDSLAGISGIKNAGYLTSSDENLQALLIRLFGTDSPTYLDRAALEHALAEKEIEVGFVIQPDLSYEAIYQDRSMMEERDYQLAGILTSIKKEQLLISYGLSSQDYAAIESSKAEGFTTILGQNSMSNYWITFVLLLIVYFIVLLYGSSVSSIIAREKDSRTMEILITSTRPSRLIIGKVAAAGLAAIVQFGSIVLVAVIGFQLNQSTYPAEVLQMVQGSLTPAYLWSYAFFSFFGFILYLFLYAALGSTVSKMEDLASATGLVQFLFIAGYLLATMAAQMPDSPVTVVASIIPFTSIMVMPIRFGLVTVPVGQVLLAAVLMLAFVAFFAFLSIKIYRWGSLNYGNKTKLRRIVKEALRGE
jgi:ABC-2 type transport system permease protein